MKTRVTTFYLEMNDRSAFRPGGRMDDELRVTQAEIPCPEVNRFFYLTVGADWKWYERRTWDNARWLAYLSRAEHQTWIGSKRGTPVGYFELERVGLDVEIVYFGLLPTFVGQGLGSALLSKAIECAWSMNATRVWVHTCNLDHPAALENYRRRGFAIYKTVEHEEDIPEETGESLPGAKPTV